jgi:hypothetical protein
MDLMVVEVVDEGIEAGFVVEDKVSICGTIVEIVGGGNMRGICWKKF